MPADLERNGFQMLNIAVDDAVAVALLPDHHDNPSTGCSSPRRFMRD